MKTRRRRRDPEIVIRAGKPAAVILSIDEYRRLLEKAEDIEDLNMLKAMRKRPLKFRNFYDFLKDSARV
jgi:PHD/YefM family antitoxin component YafN of YafNO toxin-antitoxin module